MPLINDKSCVCGRPISVITIRAGDQPDADAVSLNVQHGFHAYGSCHNNNCNKVYLGFGLDERKLADDMQLTFVATWRCTNFT
jgi:hypothetical protein